MPDRPGTIVDVDPAGLVLAWLLDHPLLRAELDVYDTPVPAPDPGGTRRVFGVVRPPYPMIEVLDTPGGDDGDLLWRTEPEVMIRAWGSDDGTPGPAALRRLISVALVAVKQLPDRPVGDYDPVVTAVSSAGARMFDEDPSTKQPFYFAPVLLTVHPPRLVAA